jgi:hypothetical protein
MRVEDEGSIKKHQRKISSECLKGKATWCQNTTVAVKQVQTSIMLWQVQTLNGMGKKDEMSRGVDHKDSVEMMADKASLDSQSIVKKRLES